MADACVFCAIVAGTEPATQVAEWGDALAIVPLNPVVPGHLLVIPTWHVRDASEWPGLAGIVAQRAAELARPPYNLITSAGAEATQTVFHLHWHIVPRTAGDGLALPWTSPAAQPATDHLGRPCTIYVPPEGCSDPLRCRVHRGAYVTNTGGNDQ